MAAEARCFTIEPGGALQGVIGMPGDKSISHRALMLGAIADGVTRIEGFLEAGDTLATLEVLRALGVTIERCGATLLVHGAGREGLRRPDTALDFGNSGTGLRLCAGLLAGQPFPALLKGDASLSRRPMRRISEPLSRMGARVRTSPGGTAPLWVGGGRAGLRGIDYEMPVASAQVKSCVLLAGLYARGTTRVHEPAPSRDHTERMLTSFGYPVEHAEGRVSLRGGGRLHARALRVPGDLSSAAFFLVGSLIGRGGVLRIEGVGVNPARAGVIEILRRMGGRVEVHPVASAGEEPVADLVVRSSELHGIDVAPEWVPLAIDEFPALFVAAACARGVTRVRGAGELRVKESDRLAVAADGLRALGIEARTGAEDIEIRGGRIAGGRVDARGDHRIAMAFSMAALRAEAPVIVEGCHHVGTSFPGFVARAAAAGLGISATGAR